MSITGPIEKRTNADFLITGREQSRKGMEKYGHYINPKEDYDWYRMAMAELVDGARYLTALQARLEYLEEENRRLKAIIKGEEDEQWRSKYPQLARPASE